MYSYYMFTVASKNTITEGKVIILIDPYGGYTAYFLYLPWQLDPILLLKSSLPTCNSNELEWIKISK